MQFRMKDNIFLVSGNFFGARGHIASRAALSPSRMERRFIRAPRRRMTFSRAFLFTACPWHGKEHGKGGPGRIVSQAASGRENMAFDAICPEKGRFRGRI
jgi:hypothetical protein